MKRSNRLFILFFAMIMFISSISCAQNKAVASDSTPELAVPIASTATPMATASPTPTPTPIPTPEAPALLDHVVFTDAVLEERVRAAMNRPQGDISAQEAAAVTVLNLNAPENVTEEQRFHDISALWYFMNLKELQFMRNGVTDISPLSCMKQLETLYMSWNQVTDINPLAHLDALFIVSMDDNGFSDIGALANKQGLVILSIDNNAVTDISPLGNDARLENLSMRGNQVTDLNPLAGLTLLNSLNISGNPIKTYDQLEGIYPNIRDTDYELLFARDIPDMPLVFNDPQFEKALRDAMGIYDRPITQRDAYVVQDLQVCNDKSEGSAFSDISPMAYFVNLKSLYFNANKITDLSPLSGLTKLKRLDVGFNQVVDVSPLAQLTQLESLKLHCNRITDVSPLAALTNLNELWLKENPITDFSPLKQILPNLTSKDFDMEG